MKKSRSITRKINKYARKYSDEELMTLLIQKAKQLGRAPIIEDVETDPNMPDATTYASHFGTFRAAVRKTDYRPKGEYSNEEMLRLFKEKAKKLGRSPTNTEIDNDPRLPSSALYFKRFGALKNIQLKLGIKPNIHYYSNEELIKILKKKAKELGHPPTYKDFNDDKNLPHVDAYYTHFNSLQNARKIAGCPSSKEYRTYTEQELLKILKKKIRALGRMPVTADIDKDENMPHSATYSRRFGGWHNLMQKFGFHTRKRIRGRRGYLTQTGEYDIPKILNHLKKRTRKLKRLPIYRELEKDPKVPWPATLRKLFGGMQNLAKLVGAKPPQQHIYHSNEEFIKLLQMKVEELGRAPNQLEVNKDKRLPTACSYRLRFGSYMKALDKIGLAPPFKFITKNGFKKEISRFKKKYGKIPTEKEFEKSPEFPSLSIARHKDSTWNQILTECGLPIHSNKGPLYINRRAELIVKNLLSSSNCEVDDLTAKNAQSPYSFKVNGKIRIHVSGSTWYEQRWKHRNLRWSFHVPPKKEFDYMVGVGFNKRTKVEAIYVFPVDILQTKAICTSATRIGKYSQFQIDNLKKLIKFF